MKTRTLTMLMVLIGMSASLRAGQPFMPVHPGPTDAKTTDDIVKAVEPNKGFGQLQTVEFNRWGRRVFAIWYCPFSGRGDCYLSVYYYDLDKAQWTRFIDQMVLSGGDLSAEMASGDEIIFRSSDGKVQVKESVANFPQKKP